MTSWLSLVDYANKYKVSISTLRRKIKIEEIPFRLDSGKYFIIDEPMHQIGAAQGSQLELVKPVIQSAISAPLAPSAREIEIPELETPLPAARPVSEGGESVLVAANRLLDVRWT